MIHILLSRWRQGHRTMAYPRTLPALPERFRGRPGFDPGACAEGCRACADACPTGAIRLEPGPGAGPGPLPVLHRVRGRLPRRGLSSPATTAWPPGTGRTCPGGRRARRAWPRPWAGSSCGSWAGSLKLRVVSAGGCNGCEVDVNVLGTLAWDLGRFGIQFVASPRHADGLVICGPVTANMALALRKTYDAVPDPKIVIAVGACAISGGPYLHQAEQLGGAAGAGIPVDLFVPGCPPHPLTILDGLLRLLGKIR